MKRCRVVIVATTLQHTFFYAFASLAAHIVHHIDGMEGHPQIVHPFHGIPRHIADTISVRKCRADRMQFKIGITVMPSLLRFPPHVRHINPFSLGRQAVRIYKGAENKSVDTDA